MTVSRLKAAILALLLLLCSALQACSSAGGEQEDYSFKSQMDIAMRRAADPKTLAAVNGEPITQTDVDLFLIGGEKFDLDDVIRLYVTSDYAEKNSLTMHPANRELYDSLDASMAQDSELTEEYCLEEYGIPKRTVIEYAKKRAYLIGMSAAFSDMVTDEVSSGETPKNYPELKNAYEKFERDKLHTGGRAWEEIENAYYEMISKEYDIVIY